MRTARLVALAALAALLPVGAAAGASTIRLLEVDGAITPATSWRVDLALEEAEASGDQLVLIEIDTPGGLVASTETIVQSLLASPVPIAVYVTPSGAHAASAGFYILIAADVAAMAPGTRTGAASVVFGAGENDPDDILLRKATEDAAALVRTIAERRGRNVEAAERTVLEAKAYTDGDALAEGLIDLIARDRADLLERLDGREVRRFDGSPVVLETVDATVVPYRTDFKGKVLEWIAHPSVAFLLLVLGGLGLWVEFQNPGLIAPAVVGVVCLVLFAVASQVLPINAVGLLLIVGAIVLFVLEVKVASFGLLTAGGIVCLVLGSALLVDGPIPELRVPPAVYLPTALGIGALVGFAVWKIKGAHDDRVATGREGLLGEIGVARTDLAPEGKIHVHGEFWDAASASGTIASGTRVRVVRVDELHVTVEPSSEAPATEEERS